jgi:long-chain fatty acid transport protein
VAEFIEITLKYMNPTPTNMQKITLSATLVVLVSILGGEAQANGINRNGIGARSSALGGASTADVEDGLAMTGNPALLGFMRQREWIAGMTGAFAEGNYTAASGWGGSLHDTWALMPELAFITPLNDRASLGFSLTVDSSRLANWRYVDPLGAGAAGIAYGYTRHRSEILNARAAVSAGFQVSDTLSLGVSVGGVNNRNELKAPYIFQSHPVLTGLKTMLDLETDGWGVNADAGLVWKASDAVTVGFSVRTPTNFDTDGRALGDITPQLAALGINADGTFRYDADVDTELPLRLSLGTTFQATPKLRLFGQVDWENWEDAYDSLTVSLSNGSNAGINGVLGSTSIVDVIPLNWEDRFIFRAGAEYAVNENVDLRFGYSYGESPVPNSTLLPLVAGISEHTLSAGVGWHKGPWTVDFAWQYDLPASQTGGNAIAGTEYDNSKVSLSAHWVSLTVGRSF